MDLTLVLKFWKSDVLITDRVHNHAQAAIPKSELQALLQQLSQVSDVRIRCSQSGDKSTGNFMYVTVINSDSVILYDDQNSKRHQVNFCNIHEFEVDKEFRGFKSNHRYRVKLG